MGLGCVPSKNRCAAYTVPGGYLVFLHKQPTLAHQGFRAAFFFLLEPEPSLGAGSGSGSACRGHTFFVIVNEMSETTMNTCICRYSFHISNNRVSRVTVPTFVFSVAEPEPVEPKLWTNVRSRSRK